MTARLAFMFMAGLIAANIASAQTPPWMDPSLSAGTRASLLVAAMTLDEKIAMVHGVSGSYCGDVPANSRLGIPPLNFSDGPAGVTCWSAAIADVTAFPAPVAVAAGWDRALAREVAAAIGRESRGKGIDVHLAPMLNTVRDARYGRAFEVYGEDPWLAAAMAEASVLGLQETGSIATAKAFVNNDQETDRGTGSSEVSERAQREIYHPPFRAAARAGGGAFMSAYNRVNGRWASEGEALASVLKDGWGYPGFVMTDWWASFSTVAAALNGLDMEQPADYHFGAPLKAAVEAGQVPPRQLDAMVARTLTSMFRAGMFDREDTGSRTAFVRTPEHDALARRAAEQGTVLLKNDRASLPIAPWVHSIAVLGTAASESPVSRGGGSSAVTLPYEVTPLDGITARAGSGITVAYRPGDGGRIDDAVALAATSDLAIVVLGVQSTEGEDRASLALEGDRDELVARVTAANANTIVVLDVPGPVLMPWAADVAAIVVAWYPGQENGNALASVLFGDSEPAGRLPVSFPRSAAETPTADPARFPGAGGRVRYDEGVLVGYRWYDATATPPLFPFGHGLSYSKFDYSNLAIVGPSASGQVEVAFDVENAGARRGAEVAQLYLGLPASTFSPPRQLRAFEKVWLAPGETRRVCFTLTLDDLAAWDETERQFRLVPGSYEVGIGASSRDLRLAGAFEVTAPPDVSDEANRALFALATATGGEAGRATDGDPSTAWVAPTGAGDALTVDLGVPRTVERVTLRWGQGFARAYAIDLSEDGVSWETAVQEGEGRGGIDDHAGLAPTRARFVRLVVQRAAGTVALSEIQVFSRAQRPHGSARAMLQGRVEAEDFDEGGEGVAYHDSDHGPVAGSPRAESVDIENDATASGGLAVVGVVDGEWLEYSVDLPDSSAIYEVRARVSATESGARLRVRLDGETVAVIPVASTGGAWAVASAGLVPVPRGGPRTLRLEAEGSGFRIDWIEFDKRRSCRKTNAAAGRPVVFSTRDSAEYDGAFAVDGNPGTRWASQPFWDPQWIRVDLGERVDLCWVRLDWEYAYGKDYGIHVSDDAVSWHPVATVAGGDGGEDCLAIPDAGRHVLMYGTARGTTWGYSLYEFEVYASCSAVWHRDADGDGFGDPSVTLAACERPASYVADATDCDDTRAGAHPGALEVCNGLDDDCNGSIDDGIAPIAGTPALSIDRDGPAALVWWSALANSTGYDLARGRLAALVAGGGDFGAAGDTCLAGDTPDLSALDPAEPPVGDGFWYLARGVSSCNGSGTYDDGEISQKGSRDPELSICP